MMHTNLIKPPALRAGSTIGVFTPSWPAHIKFREKYLYGVETLKHLGFQVIEGSVTQSQAHQGYRTGSPQDRAREFMELIRNPEVKCMIATTGGNNSSSLIPYLDFDEIRRHPKIICGYSDITSLHLSILAYAGLRTFYGPAVMPSFGEHPEILPETRDSFLAATQGHLSGSRQLTPPKRWSNQLRTAATDAWKTGSRTFENNPGWRVLSPGEVEAPIIVANLNTLMASAGTSYFPNVEGKILLIEEMNAPIAHEERNLRHLERLGVFDVIQGLIIGKPEVYDQEGAPFDYNDLILEVVDSARGYPIVSEFDCSHTNPMLTIAEMTRVSLQAKSGYETRFSVLEPMVDG